jgi:tRNA nucleotidyltransferase/poly(A) polymerase
LLIDPTNGQADLANRELRATNSSSFFDDPARIFRLIRFRHALGFELAPRTQSQLENALVEQYQEAASPAALAREIRAAWAEPNVVAMLEAFDASGLLRLLSPGLTGAKLNAQGLARLEKSIHGVLPAGTQAGGLAFLAVMTEKLSTSERAAVLRSFELTHAEQASLKHLDAQAKKLESALKSSRIHRPSDVWAVLREAPADEVLMTLYHSNIRLVHDRIRAFYEKYLPQALEITEEQVIAAGAKPGTPKFEKTLRAMIAARVNARPRKVVPEPEPGPVAVAGAAVRGRK